MIWVGIMGGMSYANSNYLVLNDNKIKYNEKELALGICKII